MTALGNAFDVVSKRWNLNVDQMKILSGNYNYIGFSPFQKHNVDFTDRVGYILAISLGLGILFDEDEAMEIKWLNSKEETLQNKSPLEYMLGGHIKNLIAVSELVERMRNI